MKLLTTIKTMILALGIVGFSMLPLHTVSAAGADVLKDSCKQSGNSALCASSDNLFGPGSTWTKIINLLIFVIAAVAVIMIVVGGFRYTVSGGDSGQVNGAKNTILYSVVGLVIAASAYGIVNFVLSKI